MVLLLQDLLALEGSKVLSLLQRGGVFYACGRKDMLDPIKASLKAAAVQNGVDFDSFFKALVASKRWRAEVY